MGIYKQGYRKFEGKLQGRFGRIMTIFKNEFIRRLKNKWVLALLLLAWVLGFLPTILTGGFMFFFVTGFIWILLFTAVAGGPIIAEDIEYNAITLYFSRPIERMDYFIGKYLTLFALISLIALLPNIFISAYVVGMLYGTSTEGFDYYTFGYSLIGIGILMTFVFTNLGMAFSALTKNFKYAAGGIFTVIFFSNIISIVLSNLYRNIIYCSIWSNFLIIFNKFNDFRDNDALDFDPIISFGILMLISIICLIIIWFRIYKAEVSE